MRSSGTLAHVDLRGWSIKNERQVTIKFDNQTKRRLSLTLTLTRKT